MGRTEADPQIMNEPWSSMQALKKTNKTTHRSEWRSLLKKDLTGPTLLEMSGKRSIRHLELRKRLESALREDGRNSHQHLYYAPEHTLRLMIKLVAPNEALTLISWSPKERKTHPGKGGNGKLLPRRGELGMVGLRYIPLITRPACLLPSLTGQVTATPWRWRSRLGHSSVLIRSLKDYKPSYQRLSGLRIIDSLVALLSLGFSILVFRWIPR
jgi:hypothetical protein